MKMSQSHRLKTDHQHVNTDCSKEFYIITPIKIPTMFLAKTEKSILSFYIKPQISKTIIQKDKLKYSYTCCFQNLPKLWWSKHCGRGTERCHLSTDQWDKTERSEIMPYAFRWLVTRVPRPCVLFSLVCNNKNTA